MSMIQSEKLQVQALLGRLLAFYEVFQQNTDPKNAQRAMQLANKLNNYEYAVAFCGHFSAGKSTMINRFVGGNLLPSSPIPTSANLVKVVAGEEYAKVYFKKEKPRLYLAPYDYEKVKSYCKDGDEIESVEISYKHANLPENVVIMDTPGIDSTDEAHRVATESALHLADLVLYVMDYNHVQSEVNFLFTKELTQVGKEFCLVINQIDKHRVEEVSFEQFKESVKNSFASWGVRPKQIFYTSLTNPLHPENQFSELQHVVKMKMEQRNLSLPITIYQSLVKLANDHIKYVIERDQTEMTKLEGLLAELSPEMRATLPSELEMIQVKRKELKQEITQSEQEFTKETSKIFNNAYIMPFQTRELAERYLQACQPNFKIGLFFSKGKTGQARTERLEKFYLDLAEKVKSQLDWHLRQFMDKTLKDKGILRSDIMEQVQSFSVPFTKALLEQTVKKGARLSGDYILNYTNDVVNEIKRVGKRNLDVVKELYLRELTSQNRCSTEKLNDEYKKLHKYHEAIKKQKTIVDYHEELARTVETVLKSQMNPNEFMHKVPLLLDSTKEELEVIRNSQPMLPTINENKDDSLLTKRQDQTVGYEAYSKEEIAHLVNSLRFTAEKISFLPELEKVAVELIKRAESLENKQFTVALFGAFSAGKSSFANALIGENLLPVSPNPTTAAINRIKPVDQEHTHGTAIVKLKPAKALLNEVKRSLEVFNKKATSFTDAIEFISGLVESVEDFDSRQKPSFTFLHAFYQGFAQYETQLGQTLEIDLQEFRNFVSIEEKSCLVEWIDVYYDCILTRQGITLVDTPGADSIHARHTNLAFNYIKNSDAILFVTYYNHAFSKADREFLIQLGRVKETFELDKMFFIINAIDLANSTAEMDMVVDYVQEKLQTYGIRNPSIFALSSLVALKEKINQSSMSQSRIELFEEAFYQFINGELMGIVISATKKELLRARQLVNQFILSAQQDSAGKEQKRMQTNQKQESMRMMLTEHSSVYLNNRLTQEANELLYYIKQRVFYRLNDFFKESFSPAVLQTDGRNTNYALQNALQEFLDSLSFDFVQELKATNLRIEAFIIKMAVEQFETVAKEVSQIERGLTFSPFEVKRMEEPLVGQPFDSIDKRLFKHALSLYKNPKSFFEKNEKKFMLEELLRVLEKPSDDYLQDEGERIKTYYLQALDSMLNEMLREMIEQSDQYYRGILATLRNDFPIKKLIEVEEAIAAFNRDVI